MVGPFRADWSMVGVVTERRELTSQKNAAWRGYVVKLAGLGDTYELEVSSDLYRVVVPHELVEASGHFENRKGVLKLVTERIAAVGKDAPVRPRVAV